MQFTVNLNLSNNVDWNAVAAWAREGLKFEETWVPQGLMSEETPEIFAERADPAIEDRAVHRVHTPAPDAAKVVRRGRKSNAEKAAEAAAAEQQTEALPAEPVVIPPHLGTPAPVVLGTPVVIPPHLMATPTPVQVEAAAPVPVAMPVAAPIETSGGMTMEQLNEAVRQIQLQAPSVPHTVMSRDKWSDGTAKDMWWATAGVPAEHRLRLVQEMQAALLAQ